MSKLLTRLLCLVVCGVFPSLGFAADSNPCTEIALRLSRSRDPIEFDNWSDAKIELAAKKLWENISPAGALPGTVIASPSRSKPDYFRHWTRDAALTMDAVAGFFEDPTDPGRAENRRVLMEYANLSRRHQNTQALGGIAEPFFLPDGSTYNQDWGRPQWDGPALRANTLIRFAHQLINDGEKNTVRNELYSNDKNSLIKRDLEAVADNWRRPSFEPWEEVEGQHFFNLMVQRKAMLNGASLAERMGDKGARDHYLEQAGLMKEKILEHYHRDKGLIYPTLNRTKGVHYKDSNLDAQVMLAVLHGSVNDGFFDANDERVISTAHQIKQYFKNNYRINKLDAPGVAIGRYPEDKYDGITTEGTGNSWPLLNHAFAEWNYRCAREIGKEGKLAITDANLPYFKSIVPAGTDLRTGQSLFVGDPKFHEVIKSLRAEGDSFLLRSEFHAKPDGSLDEQVNKDSGYQQGAKDLTWNYGSLLTALQERNRARTQLKNKGIHLYIDR